ncbi:hypothetical protein N9948_00005 [bacterium]|nr:hypothetical protein [bacterium]
MMIESSIVKYNDEVVTIDIGEPASVEFNFEKMWEFQRKKKSKGNWDPKLLNYYHVHPEGMLWYSQTDLNCAKGFHLAFGACFNFHIITYRNSILTDEFYKSVSFYYNPEYPDRLIQESDSQGLDGYSVYLLKALSYGHVNLL